MKAERSAFNLDLGVEPWAIYMNSALVFPCQENGATSCQGQLQGQS